MFKYKSVLPGSIDNPLSYWPYFLPFFALLIWD